jgi:hypothetical protein
MAVRRLEIVQVDGNKIVDPRPARGGVEVSFAHAG